jgi:hypothetical protein
MVQALPRTPVRGPTFIRLLASLTDAAAPSSPPPLPDRLSQWLDWNQAIALSTALDARPVQGDLVPFTAEDEDECIRQRATLTQAIVSDRQLAAGLREDDEHAEVGVDFAILRQRYLTHQRAMQAAAGRLRGKLRDRLAGRSAEMARLASVDAALELALSPREHMLLAAAPRLLGAHFERLRQAAEAAANDAQGAELPSGETSAAWLDVFRKDMQSVLLAELDVRFQPVEGLLAALRAS